MQVMNSSESTNNYMQVETANELICAIRMYMQMNYIPQDVLADKIGKSKQVVSTVFTKRNPSTELLFEIVNALDIPIFCGVLPKNSSSKKRED